MAVATAMVATVEATATVAMARLPTEAAPTTKLVAGATSNRAAMELQQEAMEATTATTPTEPMEGTEVLHKLITRMVSKRRLRMTTTSLSRPRTRDRPSSQTTRTTSRENTSRKATQATPQPRSPTNMTQARRQL